MAKPLVVVIPHQLGLAEAHRRLEAGIEQARAMLQKAGLSMAEASWQGERLSFVVGALNQKVDGHIDVAQDTVRVEVNLPLILSLFSGRLQQIIDQNGAKLLTKS